MLKMPKSAKGLPQPKLVSTRSWTAQIVRLSNEASGERYLLAACEQEERGIIEQQLRHGRLLLYFPTQRYNSN
ncbi:hypothetical protein SAMN04487969_108172 [Paenibacillus algorifonticola]|uniref:Uncharacterized protein n=1 Tax=Paenibacillus algorifonticola TaxID=684063 RepID=A0A1I2E4K5_9BACL|nr:hypothetical protein SAMN04487969_108172 [Paenibacillus algorifonticola]